VPTRDAAPAGAPCWADLWTSDVDGSRRFYTELFGWEAGEPATEFGGYFIFTRDGAPVAGCMGDMGDLKAANTWTVYLATADMGKTLEAAEADGAQIASGAMPVADLGVQAVLTDPTGAQLGAWQPGSFPGFTVLGEQGTPSWFELHTRDYDRAVAFYRAVFGWDTVTVGDTDEFRYTVMRDPARGADAGGGELAGIMDAARFLPEGEPAHWSVYWHADDVDPAVAAITAGRVSAQRPGEHALRPPGRRRRPGGRPVQAARTAGVANQR
jgi:predicted enzyme related to lactoylglutathione lyase